MKKPTSPLENGRRPSPDNRGLAKERPKDVEEEAAKINRDVDALSEQVEKDMEKNRKKSYN